MATDLVQALIMSWRMTVFPRGEIALWPDVKASCSPIQDITALHSHIRERVTNATLLLSTLLLLPFPYTPNVLSVHSYLHFISLPSILLSVEEESLLLVLLSLIFLKSSGLPCWAWRTYAHICTNMYRGIVNFLFHFPIFFLPF